LHRLFGTTIKMNRWVQLQESLSGRHNGSIKWLSDICGLSLHLPFPLFATLLARMQQALSA
jgi:hypothetical protein